MRQCVPLCDKLTTVFQSGWTPLPLMNLQLMSTAASQPLHHVLIVRVPNLAAIVPVVLPHQ
jgi:hypothetical protein